MNKSLRLLFSVNSFFVFAGNLIGPLYALYLNELGIGIASVSLTWSIMLVTTTLVNFLLITKGDKVREHEYYLIAGFWLRAIAWMGFIFARDLNHIIVLQVIIGLGEAFGSTGFDAILAEHLDKKKHIKDYATWKTISNLIAAVATGVGGYCAVRFGFSSVFVFMSVVAFSCALFTMKLPRRIL